MQIRIIRHEETLAVTFRKEDCKNGVEIEGILGNEMLALAKNIRSKKGLIGHIKASVVQKNSTTMLSVSRDLLNKTIVNSTGQVEPSVSFDV